MKVYVILILIFFYQFGAAQSFNNIAVYTTQNGLSNNIISCLEKDEDGFLWIGTHEGLNQYDGTEFINVLSNSKNNLPSNSINKICCINKTTLAVSTGSGLCFLNTKTLEGKTINKPGNYGSVQNAFIAYDILYDKKEKELWVGTIDGLYVLSDEGSLKRKMEPNKSNDPNKIFALHLFKDAFDHVFFLCKNPNGFFYPDFEKNKLLPIESRIPGLPLNKFVEDKYYLRAANFDDNKITCCFSAKDPSAKKSIIVWYDNTAQRGFVDSISTKLTNNNFLFNAYSLNDTIMLINSFFGEPWLYNLNTHQIKPAASHPLWFTSWPDGIVVKLLVDEQNIWGASSKGLIQIPQQPGIFKNNTALINTINANPSLISYNFGIYHNNKFWLSCLGTGLFLLKTC